LACGADAAYASRRRVAARGRRACRCAGSDAYANAANAACVPAGPIAAATRRTVAARAVAARAVIEPDEFRQICEKAQIK
jgi:hypothetical protein